MWYHAKCDNLSASDLKALHYLTEDYIRSSCTHVGGVFDFGNALLRLETATRVGMLESAIQLETTLLRNTPAIQARTNELLFGTKTVDVVAHDILNKTGEFVHLFIYLIF